MAEWSALKRWKAHLADRHYGDHQPPLEYTYTGDPEPGTGKIHLFCSPQPWAEGLGWFDRKHVPDFLLRPMWSATWTDEGKPEIANCPVTHKRGVYEWTARQPAAEVVELIEHTSRKNCRSNCRLR
ncbi:hypothetical protein [Actinopolymorpha rutila]|uniref:Uncharacterized protein n=2 Tax=Actinopolymorpha rutila TaxID=446787 RepID=A0A852ZIM9_9ACTN|nr:hypothetical protein [Actinopolymorpha rutila]NYH92971.1 hypothetical protein [Actinopolymorpha rutila]